MFNRRILTVLVITGALFFGGGMYLFRHSQPSMPLVGYTVDSVKYSYFKLDAAGKLVTKGELPIPDEQAYVVPVTLVPKKTALIVMDPWIDMASDHLNSYFNDITESYLRPLVNRALQAEHLTIFLSNDPAIIHYNTKIPPYFEQMVDNRQCFLLYHNHFDAEKLDKWLRKRGIDTLVYTGYAANQCVIGRELGMVNMARHGFRLFFVPEASASIEPPGGWQSQPIHHAMTVTISQWLGNIIHWMQLMEAMEPAIVDRNNDDGNPDGLVV